MMGLFKIFNLTKPKVPAVHPIDPSELIHIPKYQDKLISCEVFSWTFDPTVLLLVAQQ